ncbi:hypothetical protein AKJ66_04525 [candidate division MSBL1 archaeon SCGC-AAA259E22]|uniref:Uncharacterized protein n=1 Tax=candidate division MSBL1 archaeon SCGC-AAA259E22 TaxID=1698265 RepID=A0A133UDP7_9EURY|nr:hypothetical protein AKJ66_04525 [candidate division MSBL1 archaeon SCGC-AAA259E22]
MMYRKSGEISLRACSLLGVSLYKFVPWIVGAGLLSATILRFFSTALWGMTAFGVFVVFIMMIVLWWWMWRGRN